MNIVTTAIVQPQKLASILIRSRDYSRLRLVVLVELGMGSSTMERIESGCWQGQRVAVKRLFLRDQASLIQKEIELIKSLLHRHIIPFLDVETIDGCFVLITDFADGRSLQEIIVQDCSAVEADAASEGLLDGPAKTRIARDMASGTTAPHVANGKMQGTLRWMAPELLAIKPKYTTKSDIPLHSPVPRASQGSMIADRVRSGGLEDFPEETPDAFQIWIERCWAQDPARRPEADEMVEGDIDGFERRFSGSEAGTISISESFIRMGLTGIQSSVSSTHPSSSSSSTALHSTSSSHNVDLYSNPPSSPVTLPKTVGLAPGGDKVAQFTLGSWSYERRMAGDAQGSSSGIRVLYASSVGRIRELAERGGEGISGWLTRCCGANARDSARLDAQSGAEGDAEAENAIGWFYQTGFGVAAKDATIAAEWYYRAANKGNHETQNNLGWLYHTELGVDRTSAHVAYYYREAAEQGHIEAHFRLYKLYALADRRR
ncbi:hypothetical protein BGZ73_006739 [Actinomortierella ambigua]|nr:hypothetical protein BGZ73_006739 [Actinomortierella ambigua]